MNKGGSALQSRGEFLVALDGSPATLEVCRHLADTDWAWSATRFIPVMENWVPPNHARNLASSIYKALYPHNVEVARWRTQHTEPERAALEFNRQLQKNGDRPKFDFCLLSASGADSLANCQGGAEEFALAAVYTSISTNTHRLALTPRALEPARALVLLEETGYPIPEHSLLHPILASAEERKILLRIGL